ncbi:uncharacterized protein LAESUDRAFT_38718 [Laetiporus sulphureus 93-53]|uniref:Uncharacterized protein n=1 Tax=Laetiporus sulphureus 93-53 TaxID=1314785 RepID=A0A165IMM8_9APHY|nr:uncharacterized protein LAESUDRAFT_38718 [Laetiporus sulphureus 93-53]KZT13290.1 hypothetical protein LAESUDRAFT_38718 [Laetiporus sulphureus 93-53]
MSAPCVPATPSQRLNPGCLSATQKCDSLGKCTGAGVQVMGQCRPLINMLDNPLILQELIFKGIVSSGRNVSSCRAPVYLRCNPAREPGISQRFSADALDARMMTPRAPSKCISTTPVLRRSAGLRRKHDARIAVGTSAVKAPGTWTNMWSVGSCTRGSPCAQPRLQLTSVI